MSKVTSKFQLTLPRRIARDHKIGPGTELSFVSSGESLRIVIQKDSSIETEGNTALAGFDAATQRQAARDRVFLKAAPKTPAKSGRGWTREDLYAERLHRDNSK